MEDIVLGSKKTKKAPPFEFVIEALAALDPFTRPMFGCTALYIQNKIMLILRDRKDHPADNGIWICTMPEHHTSLQKVFPKMRSISLFGPDKTAWQVLSPKDKDFEKNALTLCDLIIKGDPRIGKVPKQKKRTK